METTHGWPKTALVTKETKLSMGEESWADVMSDEESAAVVPRPDFIDGILKYFPVPGEIWVHLFGAINYLPSILTVFQLPMWGEAPFMVNAWRSVSQLSPYRVTYSFRNPAIRGVILGSDVLVPNFSLPPDR